MIESVKSVINYFYRTTGDSGDSGDNGDGVEHMDVNTSEPSKFEQHRLLWVIQYMSVSHRMMRDLRLPIMRIRWVMNLSRICR